MSAERAPARELSHLPALDGLRGVAILLVLLHHLFITANFHHLLSRAFLSIAAAGWVGVNLFFVLSGFLITRILVASKESPHYFRNFYARRTLRIFPLYFGVLAIAFLLLQALHLGVIASSSVSPSEWQPTSIGQKAW
ncbi:MAG TPA: acyltransferase [Tepidisphaeraceae bacterium]|nr:acyltransferase [Tepidisphaeraceae bacterium]